VGFLKATENYPFSWKPRCAKGNQNQELHTTGMNEALSTNTTSKNHYHATLANGLTVRGERFESVHSVALSLLLPAGAANDPVGQEGSAALLGEMLSKGAGQWDSRALSEQFETIGAHYGISAGVEVTSISCVLLGENLGKALSLLGTMVLQPRLPEEELEAVQQNALQQIHSLEDEPASKVMVTLGEAFHPFPFGRNQLGTVQGVESTTIDSLREYYQTHYQPNNGVLAVAGNFVWSEVLEKLEAVFGTWHGEKALLEELPPKGHGSVIHLPKDSNQVQIALGYRSVPLMHRDYYTAKVSIGVLSGGMSGRLFVEVREKRGLVYNVSANHSTARSRAGVFAFAGTTPAHAQETLTVMVEQLQSLRSGVTSEELHRAKADLKARVIMQGESTSSRASALANDWWSIKRVRPLEEIKSAIDAVTAEDIERHAQEVPVSKVTLVTLGPSEVTLPSELL
jgi:predicted Zn-dependent peptidase